jgi:extradiol dioxygenase
MGIRRLGYVGLDVTDTDAWAELLGPTLGVGCETDDENPDKAVLAAMDAFKYRLALYPSHTDSVRHIGWIVDSASELNRLSGKVEKAGFAVSEGTSAEARLRGAVAFRWFTDPAGFRTELTLGEARARIRPARPADATPGTTALGHFVHASPRLEAMRDLYGAVLEFKLTDYRDPGLFFYRCSRNHHSVALAHADAPAIHHLEFDHGSLDDVGRALDRARENDVPIAISLGRHFNDKAISFYVENPSGFLLEIAYGGIEVGDDYIPHDFGRSDEWGHYHTRPNPFSHPKQPR